MTNPVNLNEEMQKLADYASNAAKERFGHSLDFSEGSLQQLESLLELAYKRFTELKQKGTLTEEAIDRTTQIWGSYLGEVIRRKWGGNWENPNGEIVMLVNGIEISPFSYIHNRLTIRQDYPVIIFYGNFVAKIQASSLQIQTKKIETSLPPQNATNQRPLTPAQEISDGSHPLEHEIHQEIPQGMKKCPYCAELIQKDAVICRFCNRDLQHPSIAIASTGESLPSSSRKRYFTIFGVGIVSLIIIGIMATVAVIFLLKRNAIPQEFKTNFNTFLSEAQKLDVMTSQGVNNADYKNQLVEVKSAFSMIGDSWPSSWSETKSQFEKAIEGWDLVVTAWGESIKNSGGLVFSGDRNADKYSRYLGVSEADVACDCYNILTCDFSDLTCYSYDSLIGYLMAQASEYFENGKTSAVDKLK